MKSGDFIRASTEPVDGRSSAAALPFPLAHPCNASEEISAKSADKSSQAKDGMPLAQARARAILATFRFRFWHRARKEV